MSEWVGFHVLIAIFIKRWTCMRMQTLILLAE